MFPSANSCDNQILAELVDLNRALGDLLYDIHQSHAEDFSPELKDRLEAALDACGFKEHGNEGLTD